MLLYIKIIHNTFNTSTWAARQFFVVLPWGVWLPVIAMISPQLDVTKGNILIYWSDPIMFVQIEAGKVLIGRQDNR
jgi:hypothetical protein